MLFKLPSYTCLSFLKSWLSIPEFCALKSAATNKIVNETFNYLLKISIDRTNDHPIISITSKLSDLDVNKTVVFGEKDCAKIQFEIFELFHEKNDLIGITCLTLFCSVDQLLEPVRRCESGDKVEYFMWEPVSNRNDYLVYKNSNSFGSRRNGFDGHLSSIYSVLFHRTSHFDYKGECLDGIPHGKGRKVYPDKHSSFSYDGNFDHGTMSGFGKKTYKNGDVYTGQFERVNALDPDVIDGGSGIVKSGQGEMKYSNGNIYSGNWHHGRKNGEGIMKYASGSIYTGKWLKNLKQGHGEMKCSDGNYFKGEWENDLPQFKY